MVARLSAPIVSVPLALWLPSCACSGSTMFSEPDGLIVRFCRPLMLRLLRLAAFAAWALIWIDPLLVVAPRKPMRDAAADVGRIDRHGGAEAAGRDVQEERLGGGQAGTSGRRRS